MGHFKDHAELVFYKFYKFYNLVFFDNFVLTVNTKNYIINVVMNLEKNARNLCNNKYYTKDTTIP